MSKLFILAMMAFSVFGFALCDDNNANNTNFERSVSNLGNTNGNANLAVNGNAANSFNTANGANAGNRTNSGGVTNPGDVKPGGDANTGDNLGLNR